MLLSCHPMTCQARKGSFQKWRLQNSRIFLTPFPGVDLIYTIKFMQPPLLCPLFHDPPSPSDVDITSGSSLEQIDFHNFPAHSLALASILRCCCEANEGQISGAAADNLHLIRRLRDVTCASLHCKKWRIGIQRVENVETTSHSGVFSDLVLVKVHQNFICI